MKSLFRALWNVVKLGLATGGGLLALVLFFLLLLTLSRGYNYYFGFSKERWLETGKVLRSDKEDRGILGTSNPRERMVEDVMAHHLASGMTREQVLALLGPPERDGIEWVVPDSVHLPDSLNDALMSTEAILKQSPDGFNKWHAQHAQPDTIIRYRVGWDMIDPTSMRIEFNGNGKVKRCWVGLH
jgi:hypothetical protein